MLVNYAGVSFRSIRKIISSIEICLQLSIKAPTHATVLNWVKKQGIANFQNKEYFQNQSWILIVDESIQFGNKKLLAVVAVPNDKNVVNRTLRYTDLVPLILKSSNSWSAEEIKAEIENCIAIEQVSYAVSDNGHNLTSSFSKLGVKHIEDVSHKFSLIIKNVYDKHTEFEAYTKKLAEMRTKLSLSQFSHILPPKQRVISRFMNLTPLFRWGVKMLKLIKKGHLSELEQEKVKFVLEYSELIQNTYTILLTLNKIQKLLKTKGFNKETIQKAKLLLEKIKDGNTEKIRIQINQYFEQTIQKMSEDATFLCTSDILESCFGKYKEIVKENKTVGITDLCLCIPAFLGEQNNKDKTRNAMSIIKNSDIELWKAKNIGETLYEKRCNFFKKAG